VQMKHRQVRYGGGRRPAHSSLQLEILGEKVSDAGGNHRFGGNGDALGRRKGEMRGQTEWKPRYLRITGGVGKGKGGQELPCSKGC